MNPVTPTTALIAIHSGPDKLSPLTESSAESSAAVQFAVF